MTAASDGAGSKVWLFVPSGTMPVTATWSPATFCTMFVIGETVVTTCRRPSSAASDPPLDEHPATRAATQPDARASRRTRGSAMRMPFTLPPYCKALQKRQEASAGVGKNGAGPEHLPAQKRGVSR